MAFGRAFCCCFLMCACADCAAAQSTLPTPMATNTHKYSQVVEAGGVEPPSEKPCNTKSTCLSHSEGFAGRAQNRQDALPTSPMISPPHCGPKRGNQPTV